MNHIVSKKNRAEATRLKTELVALHQLTHEKVLRDGPRFFVGSFRRRQLPVILKICLNPFSIDRHTNGGLQREILALDYLARKQAQFSQTYFLPLYAYGIQGRAWYLRAAASTKPLNLDESNFVFQPRFFALDSAAWAGRFFASLHASSVALPLPLRQRLTKGHTLQVNTALLNWSKLSTLLPASDKRTKIEHFLHDRQRIYDTHQNVLTHYEPYASHFFHSAKLGWSMIDWENVDWGNPAHDLSMLWCRGFEQPQWQARLLRSYLRSAKPTRYFHVLFETEVMLQSVHNLLYFSQPAHPIERRIAAQASRFFRANIHSLLGGDRVTPR